MARARSAFLTTPVALGVQLFRQARRQLAKKLDPSRGLALGNRERKRQEVRTTDDPLLK